MRRYLYFRAAGSQAAVGRQFGEALAESRLRARDIRAEGSADWIEVPVPTGLLRRRQARAIQAAVIERMEEEGYELARGTPGRYRLLLFTRGL